MLRALRRDRLVSGMEAYVTAVMGEAFPWRGAFDLEEVGSHGGDGGDGGAAAGAARVIDTLSGPASPLPSSHLTTPPSSLFQVVRVQASASSPVLLCSEPGHDASKQVDDLAEAQQRPMASVAMGSEEG